MPLLVKGHKKNITNYDRIKGSILVLIIPSNEHENNKKVKVPCYLSRRLVATYMTVWNPDHDGNLQRYV